MPTATATIISKYPPKPGKKFVSVKADDGTIFSIKNAMIGTIQPGGRYTFEYEEREFNGMNYKFVNTINQVQGGAAPSRAGNGAATGPDPVPERIFVCGALNAAIHAGQVAVSDLGAVTAAVATLRSAWKRTFGNPQQDAEMDDEIPFS